MQMNMNLVICFNVVICLDSFMWAYVPANRITVLCMTLNWSELLLHLGRNFQHIFPVFPIPPQPLHTHSRLGESTGLVMHKKVCNKVKYLKVCKTKT